MGDQWSVSEDGQGIGRYLTIGELTAECDQKTLDTLNTIAADAKSGVMDQMIDTFCSMFMDRKWVETTFAALCFPMLIEMCEVIRKYIRRHSIRLTHREIMCYGVCALMAGLRTEYFLPVRSDRHSMELGVCQSLHEYHIRNSNGKEIFCLAVTRDYSYTMQNLLTKIDDECSPLPEHRVCHSTMIKLFDHFLALCKDGNKLIVQDK